jgi:CRP/FNR family transcriptional regulator, anaerobic regulatory protein
MTTTLATKQTQPKSMYLDLGQEHRTDIGCGVCSSRGVCWSMETSAHETRWFDDFAFSRRRVRRGETLYRMGDHFESLYAVRSGFFKTRMLLEDGRDQVTGFRMMGELMGFDGIGTKAYANDAIALEDSEICVMPYHRIMDLAADTPLLAHELHRMMSQEIVREQGVMALLGTMQAEERVATFLLNLSARLKARHYSPTCFILRMTREEIGSYLGLKLETVSRVFGRLQALGLLRLEHNKQVTLCSLEKLRALVSERLPTAPATIRKASTVIPFASDQRSTRTTSTT